MTALTQEGIHFSSWRRVSRFCPLPRWSIFSPLRLLCTTAYTITCFFVVKLSNVIGLFCSKRLPMIFFQTWCWLLNTASVSLQITFSICFFFLNLDPCVYDHKCTPLGHLSLQSRLNNTNHAVMCCCLCPAGNLCYISGILLAHCHKNLIFSPLQWLRALGLTGSFPSFLIWRNKCLQ